MNLLFAPCASSDPGVTAGTSSSNLTFTLSCLTLDEATSGQFILHWGNGRTSTFVFNRTVTYPAGQAVVVNAGEITAGEFAGDTAVMTVAGASVNLLACAVPPGVTSQSGPIVLEITSI